MEAYQGNLGERSPRDSGCGSGHQSKSTREEKMPDCNDESNKSDDGWSTAGTLGSTRHSQTESLGYGSQDKQVDTPSRNLPTRSNQADQNVRTSSLHFPLETSQGKDRFNQLGAGFSPDVETFSASQSATASSTGKERAKQGYNSRL